MKLVVRVPSVDFPSGNSLDPTEIPPIIPLTKDNCKTIWTLAQKDIQELCKRLRESRPKPLSGSGGGWYEDPFGSAPTLAEDPVNQEEEEDEGFLYVPPPKELTNIVFDIRHKFFNWVIPQLEACCLSFAQRKLGQRYLRVVLDERALEDVSQIDLEMWKKIFDQAYGNSDLATQDFYRVLQGASRSDIFSGIEQLRHATVHRRDMEIEGLLDAMYLPELLGEPIKQAVVGRVFNLVSEAELSSFHGRDLWMYTRQHHDHILESRQWNMPEQGEMPRWEEIYRDNLPTIQNDFPDDKGKLLATCLSRARCLRNDVAHRHWRGDEEILAHVHNSIRTLMVLGYYPAALEIEIAAERWYTKVTRVEIPSLDDESPNDVPAITGTFTRPSSPFRKALTTVATEKSEWFTLTNSMWDTWSLAYERYEWFTLVDSIFDTWKQGRPAPKESCTYWWHPEDCAEHAIPDYSIPEQIRLTPPDGWDTLRETFSDSMHPVLKVLHEPQWSTIWDLDAALDHPDFPVQDSLGNFPGDHDNNSLHSSVLIVRAIRKRPRMFVVLQKAFQAFKGSFWCATTREMIMGNFLAQMYTRDLRYAPSRFPTA